MRIEGDPLRIPSGLIDSKSIHPGIRRFHPVEQGDFFCLRGFPFILL